MAVMSAFCFLRLRNPKVSKGEKVLWVALTFAEGYSRVILNYHTTEQVIAGTVYGVLYAFIFNLLWSKIVAPWLKDQFNTTREHTD